MDTILKTLKLNPPFKARMKAVLHDMHRTVTIWYSYLMGAAVAIKATDTDISAYLSVRAQIWIVGGATFLVAADKVRRAIGVTAPVPLAPPELP